MIESNKNPLTAAQIKNGSKIQSTKIIDTLLKTKRGFFSNTMTKFKFGILGKNQWVGSERLIKKYEQPFDYSAIALSQIKGFSITKSDATKFPNEFRNFISHIVDEHYEWMEKRAKFLIETTNNLAKLDPTEENYDLRMAEVKKRYPAANSQAIANIRKKQVLEKSFSPIEKISKITRNDLTLPSIGNHIVNNKKSLQNLTINAGMTPTNIQSSIGKYMTNPGSVKNSVFKTLTFEEALAPTFVKRQMNVSTSATKFSLYNNLTPIMSLNATIGSGKFRSLLNSSAQNNLQAGFNKPSNLKFLKENENKQFVIGAKIIELIDPYDRHKPSTPNPFKTIAAHLQKMGNNN